MGKLSEERPEEDEFLIRQSAQLKRRVRDLEEQLSIATRMDPGDLVIPSWTNPKRLVTELPLGVPVLCLSDLHFGERVDFDDMDGINEYNDEIAYERWQRLISQVPTSIEHHLHGHRLPFMVVALMGDMVSGDIHEELMATNELTTPDTITTWVPRIASALQWLLDAVPVDHILVPCVDGNHDRLTKKGRYKKRAANSFTWILYKWLADRFRDDERIEFVISHSSEVHAPIFDQTHVFVHGDSAGGGGGGIGGIWPMIMRYTTRIRANGAALGRNVDHVAMGHWHQYTPGGGFLVNGSLKGYDEYARHHQFKPEQPIQAMYAVGTRGIVAHWPVSCD